MFAGEPVTFASVLVWISSLVELCAAFVIVFHAARAILAIMRLAGVDRARALIAEGVLSALGLSLCATLLKVIGLQSWVQIRMFATVFVLRTLLKQVFLQEREHVLQRTESL